MENEGKSNRGFADAGPHLGLRKAEVGKVRQDGGECRLRTNEDASHFVPCRLGLRNFAAGRSSRSLRLYWARGSQSRVMTERSVHSGAGGRTEGMRECKDETRPRLEYERMWLRDDRLRPIGGWRTRTDH